MFKINNKIVVDLTPYVDIENLLSLKPFLEYAIVKNIEYQVPAQYDGDVFLDKGVGFIDIDDKTKQQMIEKYSYLSALNYKEMLLWLRYNMDITYGQSHLYVISSKTWEGKHLKDNCELTPVTETFKPFLTWLEEQNIFSSYGRVVIFLNEPNCFTPIHHDPPYPDISPKDEFIWISVDSRKRFFIFDGDTKEKTYIPGLIGTFDNHNYHGSDPCKYANWSVRIDGIFSNDFLNRTGMVGHFPR